MPGSLKRKLGESSGRGDGSSGRCRWSICGSWASIGCHRFPDSASRQNDKGDQDTSKMYFSHRSLNSFAHVVLQRLLLRPFEIQVLFSLLRCLFHASSPDFPYQIPNQAIIMAFCHGST
jgi:hypothetical protein